MRSRAVRLTLVLLAVAAIGSAGYFSWTTRTSLRAAADGTAAFEAARLSAVRETFELRSAQQAYVAAGQSEAFWFEKVATLTDSLKTRLSTLSSPTSAPGIRSDLDEAVAALEDLEQGDRRIRRYAAAGQKLLASDIIFSDGLEATARIISALDRAGAAAAEAIPRASADGVRKQWIAAGAAALVAIVVMLMLAPVQREAGAPADPAHNRLDDGLGLSLRAPAAEKTAAAPVVPEAPAPTLTSPRPTVHIETLAAVCADLARLSDTAGLPAVLARTAAALEASGLVLWIVDPDGKELVPIAAHGYPASVLARLGTIRADAENATAAAFRTGLIQTVGAAGNSPGAIAAPLVAPSGPRGVMAAEVRNAGEKQSGRLAAASIVAAQLATLIGPAAAPAEDRGTAAV
jgi:hypothetical protein